MNHFATKSNDFALSSPPFVLLSSLTGLTMLSSLLKIDSGIKHYAYNCKYHVIANVKQHAFFKLLNQCPSTRVLSDGQYDIVLSRCAYKLEVGR